MERLIAFVVSVVLMWFWVACGAVHAEDLSVVPRWEILKTADHEVCIKRELRTVKVLAFGVDDVVVDYLCVAQRYAHVVPFCGEWEKQGALDESNSQVHLTISNKEYFGLENEDYGLYSRGGGALDMFGGKLFGLMEVGCDEIKTVSENSSNCPEWALKHSLYFATNDLISCALSFVSCDRSSPNVYLGTWLVKILNKDGELKFFVQVDSRENLFSNVHKDKAGDIEIFVRQDGKVGRFKLQKNVALEYCRTLKTAHQLRSCKDIGLSAIGAKMTLGRIFGVDVIEKLASVDNYKESYFCTSKGTWHVWQDKSPETLSTNSPFDAVEHLYDYKRKTLRALCFTRGFALNAGWKDCRQSVMDISNCLFDELGIFLEFGDSVRVSEERPCFVINGFGRRWDGVCVSLALSKNNGNVPAKLKVLVEIDDVLEGDSFHKECLRL